MPQFFIKSDSIIDDTCVIEGDDFHHLAHVRRVKEGGTVKLRLEDGTLVIGKIISIGSGSLRIEIIDKKEQDVVSLNLRLCAAILKGKKFDLVIQKAIELGVSSIIPVVTERTVVDVHAKEEKSSLRWNRIAAEAAKQCMRSSISKVEKALPFSKLVCSDMQGVKIIAQPDKKSELLRDFLQGKEKERDVFLLIGPEGGFSTKEIELARENGWIDLNFGFTELRAETAAIVLPAILVHEWS